MNWKRMAALTFTAVWLVGSFFVPDVSAQQKIRWKLQAPFPAGMAIFYAAKEFSKKTEEMSGGRLEIKAFPAGAVVPALKEFEAVTKGTLDAHCSASHYHTSLVGLAGDLFNLYPGGPNPTEFAVWCYEAGGLQLWQEMYDRRQYPVVALGPMGYSSAEMFGWFKKPIQSLDDFKGMKFRTAGIWGEILSGLGAAVVQTPGGEIFESMKRGVIDAFEYSTPGIDYSAGFHQLGAYMVGPGIHAPMSGFELLVNKNSWEKLPADVKAIVRNAAEATSLRMLCYIDYQDLLAMDKLKAYGTKMHKLPEALQKEVVKKANELYDRKAKEDPFFAKVLAHQRDFLKKYRDYKNFTQPNPDLMTIW
jgi:TRAP-type mannitol/chloroaromatic compound transport system substrate-binding protein